MKEYIEREALWRAMQSIIEDPTCPLHIAATVDQYITEAPAADVVERKRGEWVYKHPNGWACSECGEWGLMIDNRGICKSNFCPNCGADMRGEMNDHP